MARAGRQLQLTGTLASAITPHRTATPEVDFAASLDLIDFLTNAGIKGISIFSPVGEFLNYTFAERQRLVYLATKRSRIPLIANVSHSTLTGSIQLAAEAVSAGADGLLLMPPYFYRYQQSEIEEFYLQFARESGGAVPLLLQNAPQVTSPLEPDTVRRLLDTGHFAGIEDDSGDLNYMASLLQLKRDRPFAVMIGNERIAAQALREGADGIISSAACAIPELITGHDEQLNEFLDWIDRFPAPAGIKHAVALRKQKSGPDLIPLAPATSQLMQEFSAWFVKWLTTI
jgi:dihydrodipicolinate synthase/N-acetylneuraminate lyase